jgi:hypothetical protein
LRPHSNALSTIALDTWNRYSRNISLEFILDWFCSADREKIVPSNQGYSRTSL